MKYLFAILFFVVQCATAHPHRKLPDDDNLINEVEDEFVQNFAREYASEKLKNDIIKKAVNKHMPFDDEPADLDMGEFFNSIDNDDDDDDDDDDAMEEHAPEDVNDKLHMHIPGDHAADHVGLGDIMFRPGEEETIFESSDDATESQDVTIVQARWPNPVPYVIRNDLGSKARAAISAAIKEFKSKTCIRFVWRTTQPDYLYFHKGRGCWSYIGKTGGKQSLSIGRGCEYKKTAVHEIMHALGFWHEQSRTDRDKYVTINWNNIEKGMAGQFKKAKPSEVTTFGHPYDYRSVMHYSKLAFGKKRKVTTGWYWNTKTTVKKLETITPKRNTELGQCNNCGMSAIDAAQLNAAYCKK